MAADRPRGLGWTTGKGYADVVSDILRALPDYRNLSYLELGCGDGYMLEGLSMEGAKVEGTTFLPKEDDYIRRRPYPQGIAVRQGVDLDRPLPYAGDQFDVVYSLEVIEHVESHRNFVSEAARVLKPGGWFVISTPNIHRLISRLHFALCGVHLLKERRPSYRVPLERMGEFHVHCPDFPLLHWLMWQSGLRIETLEPEKVHPLSAVLSLAAPLLRPLTRIGLHRYERPGDDLEEAVQDLHKWMNSVVLLTSERICLLARKVR